MLYVYEMVSEKNWLIFHFMFCNPSLKNSEPSEIANVACQLWNLFLFMLMFLAEAEKEVVFPFLQLGDGDYERISTDYQF